ncbi:hypothetical protein BGP75_20745 [Motiliproteus sp. MSK22-1]|nr:hypothetical protein BGP75_20745 [Motiliproteus sp. MSK22-1]
MREKNRFSLSPLGLGYDRWIKTWPGKNGLDIDQTVVSCDLTAIVFRGMLCGLIRRAIATKNNAGKLNFGNRKRIFG